MIPFLNTGLIDAMTDLPVFTVSARGYALLSGMATLANQIINTQVTRH